MAHAAVGLDEAKRKEVEHILAERLAAPDLSPQERADLALGLAALGDVEPQTAGDAAAALAQAFTRTNDPFAIRNLVENLGALADRMDRKAAARVCAEGAAAVTTALRESKNVNAQQILIMSHATLAARMDQREAAPTFSGVDVPNPNIENDTQGYLRVCLAYAASRLDPTEAVTLAQAMVRTNDIGALNHFKQLLSALAPRLGPAEAAEAGALLASAMTNSTQLTAPFLVQAMTALAARMEAKTASRLCAEAADAFMRSKMANSSERLSVAYRVSELAARMEPPDAARVCADAAGLIMPDLKESSKSGDLVNPVKTLTAVAARMDRGAAAELYAEATRLLLEALAKKPANDFRTLEPLAQSLSEVAARMKPGEADRVCTEAARLLMQGAFLAARTDVNNQEKLAQTLSLLAAYMEPKASCEALAQALAQTLAPNVVKILHQSLSGAATRLDPQAAGEVAKSLAQAMTKTNNEFGLGYLAQALAMVLPRMEAGEAVRVCTEAVAAIRQSMTGRQLNYVAPPPNGLAALASWIEPGEAAKTAEALVQVVTTMRIANYNPERLSLLAQSMSVLATRMEHGDAARIGDKLVQALEQAETRTDLPNLRVELAGNLAAVSEGLEPKEAAKAAAAIFLAMTKSSFPGHQGLLAYLLPAVTFRMEAKEALALLRQVKTQSNDPAVLQKVAVAMARLATRMDPEEAHRLSAEAAATFMQAFPKLGTGYLQSQQAATDLATLTAAMKPGEAARIYAEAAGALVRPMPDLAKTYNSTDHGNLARQVAVFAERMEPQDATRVCSAAAATLVQAMHLPETVTGSNRLHYLADALSAVAAHMEPREAARLGEEAALIFMQTITKTNDRRFQVFFANGLSMVLHRERFGTRTMVAWQRANYAATLVGLGASPTALAPAAVLAYPSQQPPPEPLPAETLVELLKHPLCVGESRRAVLDALGTRYRKHFADQWDFVRYAEEQKLDLDLLSPPKSATRLP
jgi:hypothetical protein